MKKEIKQFLVIGVSVRTTNQNGKARKDIGELFGKFMGEQLIEKIPNKTDSDIYCMYTEYDADFMRPYTAIIGCRVTSLEDIPEGFIGKSISNSTYKVYESTGDLNVTVGETWMKIWNSGMKRKYSADFDIYRNAKVETYVSVD